VLRLARTPEVVADVSREHSESDAERQEHVLTGRFIHANEKGTFSRRESTPLPLLRPARPALHHVATWEIAEEFERFAAPHSGSPPHSGH
jgi:hypothetical protein